MKLDLLNGKIWSPRRDMMRVYFDKKYIQVNISRGNSYYKLVGFEEELENEDEVISQISYYTNVECNRIYPSKF